MMIEPANVMIALGLLALTAPALRLVGVSTGAAPFTELRARLEAVPDRDSGRDTPERAAGPVSTPQPVSHIERLEGIVTAAVVTARKAGSFHASAHAQIDSADYALQGLRDELAAIMPGMARNPAPRASAPRPQRSAPRPIALAA